MKKLIIIIMAMFIVNIAKSQNTVIHKVGGELITVQIADIDGITFESDTSSVPSTVTDIDSNVYNTVKIGTQVWMKENLKVTIHSVLINTA